MTTYFADHISNAFSWICYHVSIGFNDGLVPNRHQAIIWTNDSLFIDAFMHHLVSMS